MPDWWNSFQVAIHFSAMLLAYFPIVVKADDFYLLSGNRSAYDARIELIELARYEIDIAYYAIDSGHVAFSLISHLRDAAKRGVKVNILVDGLKSRLPSDLENLLTQDGIELRAYHPPMLGHPLWLNRRIHYKLLVVDEKAMIVGSRNLEDSHFGIDKDNFVDMDALLTGEVCRQSAEHFRMLWSSDEVFPVDKSHSFRLRLRDKIETQTPLIKKRVEVYERRLTEAAEQIARSGELIDDAATSCVDPYVENLGCCMLVHDRGTDKSARHFQTQVIAMLDAANRFVWIESPYPVLERPVKDSLQRAIERGVKVTLLTNSLGSTDRAAPYAAYQNDKREFQRMNVELIEYTGSGTLHCKTILVDDQSVLISSYNMDARSDRLNLEFGVRINDSRVCKVIKHEVQQRMRKGEVAERNQLALPEVIRGDASFLKHGQMRLRQLMVPLIRGSL